MVQYLLFLLLFAFTLYSQDTLRVVRINNPPVIDGIIDEAWDRAVVIDEFYQRVPYPGEPVSEKTEFLLMYDSENLYVAARCYHVNPKDASYVRDIGGDISIKNALTITF